MRKMKQHGLSDMVPLHILKTYTHKITMHTLQEYLTYMNEDKSSFVVGVWEIDT